MASRGARVVETEGSVTTMTTLGMGPVNDKPRVLGNRYEVGDLLGRGGMAEVHLGRDTRLGRVVAIKLLRTDLARDATFQARFRREAQSAAALNHPAIVAVYDTGEEQVVESGGAVVALPYIVMEYVEGRTLREMLRDGQPLDVDTRARDHRPGARRRWSTATAPGIVHRDIKPANVMLTPTGDVKVMDFGIARAMADASATMTQTQAVIGTAQYLSPEQARGETVDARSDLYSAGLPALRAAHRPAAVRRPTRRSPWPTSTSARSRSRRARSTPPCPRPSTGSCCTPWPRTARPGTRRPRSSGPTSRPTSAGRPVPMYAQGAGRGDHPVPRGRRRRHAHDAAARPVPARPRAPGRRHAAGRPAGRRLRLRHRAETAGSPSRSAAAGGPTRCSPSAIFVVAGLIVFTVLKLGGSGADTPTKGVDPAPAGPHPAGGAGPARREGLHECRAGDQGGHDRGAGDGARREDPPRARHAAHRHGDADGRRQAPGQVNLPDLKGKTVSDANKIDPGPRAQGRRSDPEGRQGPEGGAGHLQQPAGGSRSTRARRRPRGRDRQGPVPNLVRQDVRRTP